MDKQSNTTKYILLQVELFHRLKRGLWLLHWED